MKDDGLNDMKERILTSYLLKKEWKMKEGMTVKEWRNDECRNDKKEDVVGRNETYLIRNNCEGMNEEW